MPTSPKKKTPTFSLKDKLFNQEKVEYLANLIQKADPAFPTKKFQQVALKKFPSLELMERIYFLRDLLEKYLPKDYERTLKILLESLPKQRHEDFIFAPFLDYVATHGCTKKYLKISLEALGTLTSYFSAEFAIRPFINHYPEETFSQMLAWSKSTNHHQRRLASEGFRPKLPWGKAIKFPYQKAAKPLDNLFADPERYVTRSVANHLNDISKFDPEFVHDLLEKWEKTKKQKATEMNYIKSHAMRTLIKKGHGKTLELMGYPTVKDVKLKNLTVKPSHLKLGETIEFSFEMVTPHSQNLLIDYRVTYPQTGKNKSQKLSQKVFKLSKIQAEPNKPITLTKRHTFKTMTTKILTTGKHIIEIQVNGEILGNCHFYLET